MPETVKLIECPRDAWQGLADFIPTDYKAEYLKELVLAGFKHIDAVSFVSPKHVKQMADSEEVMAKLTASLSDGLERPVYSWRYDDWLSLFHIGLFSQGECQYDSRGIACPGRNVEERDRVGKPRLGHLHLHGLRESL